MPVSGCLPTGCSAGRQRQRRLGVLVVILAAAGASALAFGVIRDSGSSTAIEHVPNGPVVNVSAFAHHGSLAFISRNALWVLDGTKSSLHRMPPLAGQFTPQQPLFSTDGRWLTYLVRSSNGVTSDQLWIANGDGTQAHVVSSVPISSVVGWSPRHDLFTVLAGPERSRQPCPCFTATTLRVVAPSGQPRILVRAPWVYGAVWSPAGDALAVTTVRGDDSSTLTTYPVSGARPTVWLAMRRNDRLNGMRHVTLSVAGWWKNGIGVWVFGNGMIHNNDATPLDVVAPGSVVHTDGKREYDRVDRLGYVHQITNQSISDTPAHVSMPGVHRVASLVKRWVLGTHQGGLARQHLDSYLDEFTFRFNRRASRNRGLVFYRLLQQCLHTRPLGYEDIVFSRRPERGRVRGPAPRPKTPASYGPPTQAIGGKLRPGRR
jgi:transposase-like protein